MSIRTRPHASYIPPTREEMRAAAKEVKLQNFSPSLVEDLCNLASGGELVPPSEYHGTLQQEAEAETTKTGRDGSWELPDGCRTDDWQQAVEARTAKKIKYHQNVTDFIRDVDLDSMPGQTPLERAMSLLKVLSKKQGGQPGGDGDTLPIFQDGDPSKEAKDLNELMDQVDSMSQEEKDLLVDKDKGQKEELQKREIAEDFASNKAKRIALELARKLDTLTRMRVSKEKKKIPDSDGSEIRVRQMEGLLELPRVGFSQRLVYRSMSRTLDLYKAVTSQYVVTERVTPITRKQLLYILVDCSGSMDDVQRIGAACGVLMNRLKAVIDDDAILYWRFFTNKLMEEHLVDTPEKARNAMQVLRKKNFNGGSTAIGDCVKEAQKRIDEIAKKGETYRPELVVVTDGDDEVKISLQDVGGTKLHAFMVGGHQKADHPLLVVARQSGGVGINL